MSNGSCPFRLIGRLAVSGAVIGLSGCGDVSRSPEAGAQGGGAPSSQGGMTGAAPNSAEGGASEDGGRGATGGSLVNVTGGVSGSSSASGGAGLGAAAGSSEGGGGAIGIDELVGGLDGRLVQLPGSDGNTTDTGLVRAVVDGTPTVCSVGAGGLDLRLDHPIGGSSGAAYLVTLHFYGILEPKDYGPDVVRESGSTGPANLDTGADPAPWAHAEPGIEIPVNGYNTYEVRVFDETLNEVGAYFLNSDTMEGHYTYVIDYERTIPVIGGGLVRLVISDSNCRIMVNCGTGGAPCGPKARLVDLAAADPQPPPDFTQPGLGQPLDRAGQWLMIDVTGVEAP